jgi:aminobenzoyl-glutamate utilization protein B
MSNVLNNRYLADLQFTNMQVIGPIRWDAEEIKFAEKINSGYPPGTAQAIATSFGLPGDLFNEPLLGENYPAMDEGKVMTGSTDVGDMSRKTPLSMLMTACYTTASIGHSWGVVATAGSTIGFKGMMHAAKIMALTAMDLFTDPSHLQQARAEFSKELAAHPYVNPIPEHIQPPRFTPGK